MAIAKLLFTGADCDLLIENGSVVMINGSDDIAQGSKYELETNYGDWFLGRNFGTKWLQEEGGDGILDQKRISDADIRAELTRVALKDDRITSSKVTGITLNKRELDIEMEATTEFESLTFSVEV